MADAGDGYLENVGETTTWKLYYYCAILAIAGKLHKLVPMQNRDRESMSHSNNSQGQLTATPYLYYIHKAKRPDRGVIMPSAA